MSKNINKPLNKCPGLLDHYIYHRVTPRYMLDYASEMAWREDMRKENTGAQLRSLIRRVFGAGLSSDWLNYCRGNKRKAEMMFQA